MTISKILPFFSLLGCSTFLGMFSRKQWWTNKFLKKLLFTLFLSSSHISKNICFLTPLKLLNLWLHYIKNANANFFLVLIFSICRQNTCAKKATGSSDSCHALFHVRVMQQQNYVKMHCSSTESIYNNFCRWIFLPWHAVITLKKPKILNRNTFKKIKVK